MWKMIAWTIGKRLVIELLEEILKLVHDSPEENPMAEQIIATKLNQIKRR